MRVVFNRVLLPAIEAKVGTAKSEANLATRRMHQFSLSLPGFLNGLEAEASRLRNKWRTRIETEARDLGLERAKVPLQVVPLLGANCAQNRFALGHEIYLSDSQGDRRKRAHVIARPARGNEQNEAGFQHHSRGGKNALERAGAGAPLTLPVPTKVDGSLADHAVLIRTKSGNRIKRAELSRYLDTANLTERQYECSSLKWEYGLDVSEIARELDVTRRTVDNHIRAAQVKIDASRKYEKRRKMLAQIRPGE